jgi:hypothetical protein
MSHAHFSGVDYRPRCTNETILPAFGNCRTSPTPSGIGLVPATINVTRVEDYTNTSATGIPPYPRPNPSLPSCATSPDCTTSGLPKCGEWQATGVNPSGIFACASGVTAIDYNCFQSTTGLIDLRVCRKLGFKNVQARKVWHGLWGNMAPEWGASDKFGGIETPCECAHQSYQATPSDTKYLSYFATATNTRLLAPVADGTVSRATTVNPLNGVTTLTECSSGGDDSLLFGALAYLYNNIGVTNATLVNKFCTDTDGSWALSYSPGVSLSGMLSGGSQIAYAVLTFGATMTYERSNYDLSVGDYTDRTRYTLTNTTFDILTEQWTSLGSGGNTKVNEQSLHTELSDPYTTGQVYSQLTGLLNHWDLTNDLIYPWRSDEFTTVAPFVTYNEVPSPVAPSIQECDYVDFSAQTYDGSIRGAPLPLGYAHFFDWNHATWNTCQDDIGNVAWYREFYGAYAAQNSAGDVTDAYMPLGTTQWTENYDAGNYWPHAWVDFPAQTHILTAQKWAEIQVKRPSHNFAEPCGKSRYNFDEPTVRCVSGVTTGTPAQVTIDTTIGVSNIVSNDSVLVCGIGNTGIDGGWKVTKIDDNNYTLTTRLFSFPSGYVSPYDCEGGIFGKLRFPSAPGICGKVKVIGASKAAPIVLAFNEDTWLRDGDRISVQGVNGNTAANGLFTVNVRDERTVELSGTSGSATYTNGGFASCLFAADEKWNDTESKGEFSYLNWEYNYRDVGETARLSGLAAGNTGCSGSGVIIVPAPVRPNLNQDGDVGDVTSNFTCSTYCLPFKNCSPAVICISPNGEQFNNGLTLGFGPCALDTVYGGHWASEIRQHVTDPLWQPPHMPCGDGAYPQQGIHREDDGSCQEDTTDPDTALPLVYYSQRPWVEARCELPDGAPLLPQGVYFGCLTYSQLNQNPLPSGNVCFAPNPVDRVGMNPGQRAMPWGIYLRELGCVCENGRFTDEYEQDGVGCSDVLPAP